MKKLLFLIPVLTLSILFVGCKKDVAGAKAKVGEAVDAAAASASAKTFNIDVANSSVTWTGSKVIGDNHQGKMKLSNGSLNIKDGNIEAGSFTIDLNSLVVTDLEAGKGKEDLEGHLKNEDFFDVAKFPTAKFTVSKVAKVSGTPNITHNITGNLTLKDVTKSVTFGANVNVGGNKLSAVTPQFKINRNDWGIVYGNSTIAGLAKDRVISDDVALIINLSATAN